MSLAPDTAAIGVDPDLLDRVRALSRRTGRPGAELVREALVGFLGSREDYRLPSWVAASVRGSDRIAG
jgi:predicted DNA-binding protein